MPHMWEFTPRLLFSALTDTWPIDFFWFNSWSHIEPGIGEQPLLRILTIYNKVSDDSARSDDDLAFWRKVYLSLGVEIFRDLSLVSSLPEFSPPIPLILYGKCALNPCARVLQVYTLWLSILNLGKIVVDEHKRGCGSRVELEAQEHCPKNGLRYIRNLVHHTELEHTVISTSHPENKWLCPNSELQSLEHDASYFYAFMCMTYYKL